ncbi:MAG: DoxX family protein [Moorea sp. SIO1F2]|nr:MULTISPECIES: DoxX family protein [unclassified Moorena]NEO07193.1 DoxX family protein [Moorena sp. SIO3I8]NEP22710.1 DoxX family protein [Moorena sp. SIO3I6]NEQ57032.1 DoxX family protein [Moorena sp. SIO4A1]NET84670.1 DoxX family protein [Moorena sp. SIO1F2]
MKKYIPLLGRICLCAIFIKSGIDKLFNPTYTQQLMESKGVPGILIIPTIIILLGGGLSVLLGYKARWGALALIGFLIPTTLIFHTDFSNQMQEIQFLKNLGLIGGLLMVATFGSGPVSFDNRSVWDRIQFPLSLKNGWRRILRRSRF